MMNKRIGALFLAIALAGFAMGEPTLDAVAVGFGQSRDDINISRLGLRSDFGQSWLFNTLTGFFELSANNWSKDRDNVWGAALSPVFVFQPPLGLGEWRPYVDGGIGAACISQTTIARRDMSSLYQFEDRVGAGVKWRNLDFNVGYLHYSNANIVKPNQGIDIYIATVAYAF
jgi:lipid A 3-O-deacylase